MIISPQIFSVPDPINALRCHVFYPLSTFIFRPRVCRPLRSKIAGEACYFEQYFGVYTRLVLIGLMKSEKAAECSTSSGM